MTAILGFADLLLEDLASEEAVESARIIKRNGEHLLTVIKDILDLSKIEAEKCTVDLQECSPRQIVGEVVSLMKVRADAKRLALWLGIEEDIPEKITTDPIRLRQILINLIGNAIKFTEVGGIRVIVRLDSPSGSDAKLAFDVSDTGIGISEEQIGLLFRPFSQVDGSANRRFGGSGLGLAISKRMAEMLGGEIAVRSSRGRGSTFTLQIGAGNQHTVASPEPMQATVADKEVADLPQKLACRILVAEDSPDIQLLIEALLCDAGAEVQLADNGEIALDLALAAQQSGSPFDIICMDMQMPVMDGYEATQKLRNSNYKEPIIALTAHALVGDRERCIRAGCDDYVTKPIDPERLIAVIQAWAARELSPL